MNPKEIRIFVKNEMKISIVKEYLEIKTGDFFAKRIEWKPLIPLGFFLIYLCRKMREETKLYIPSTN